MNKNEGVALYEQARKLAAEGRYGEALPLLDTLLEQYPEELQLLYARAKSLAGVGRVEEALVLCERLEREHKHARAVALKAQLTGKAASTPEAGPAPEAAPPNPRRRISPVLAFAGICGVILIVGLGFLSVRGGLRQAPENKSAAAPDAPATPNASVASDVVLKVINNTGTDELTITLDGPTNWKQTLRRGEESQIHLKPGKYSGSWSTWDGRSMNGSAGLIGDIAAAQTWTFGPGCVRETRDTGIEKAAEDPVPSHAAAPELAERARPACAKAKIAGSRWPNSVLTGGINPPPMRYPGKGTRFFALLMTLNDPGTHLRAEDFVLRTVKGASIPGEALELVPGTFVFCYTDQEAAELGPKDQKGIGISVLFVVPDGEHPETLDYAGSSLKVPVSAVLETLVPRFGKVTDASILCAFTDSRDTDTEWVSMMDKVKNLNTERLKPQLPDSNFWRLTDVIQEIDAWKVKPDACQYIPEKQVPTAEIREVLGKEGSTERSEEVMLGDLPTQKTPVDWLVYGRWKFGAVNDVVQIIRVCFPEKGDTAPATELSFCEARQSAVAPRPESAGKAITGNLYDEATKGLLCTDEQSQEWRAMAATASFAQPADRARLLKEFVQIFGEDLARKVGVTIYDAAGMPKYVWPCDNHGQAETRILALGAAKGEQAGTPVLAATSIPQKGNKDESEQVVKEGAFQLSVLGGWSRSTDVPEGFDASFRKTVAQNESASFCLHYEDMPLVVGQAGSVSSQMKSQFNALVTNRHPDARLIEMASPNVGGEVLANVAYELTDNGAVVRRRCTYFLTGHTAFVVECSAPLSQWDAVLADFDKMILTLKPGDNPPKTIVKAGDPAGAEELLSELKSGLPTLVATFPAEWKCSVQDVAVVPIPAQPGRVALEMDLAFTRSDVDRVFRACKLMMTMIRDGKTSEADFQSVPQDLKTVSPSDASGFVRCVGQTWGMAYSFVLKRASAIESFKVVVFGQDKRRIGSISISKKDGADILTGKVGEADMDRVARMYVFE